MARSLRVRRAGPFRPCPACRRLRPQRRTVPRARDPFPHPRHSATRRSTAQRRCRGRDASGARARRSVGRWDQWLRPVESWFLHDAGPRAARPALVRLRRLPPLTITPQARRRVRYSSKARRTLNTQTALRADAENADELLAQPNPHCTRPSERGTASLDAMSFPRQSPSKRLVGRGAWIEREAISVRQRPPASAGGQRILRPPRS